MSNANFRTEILHICDFKDIDKGERSAENRKCQSQRISGALIKQIQTIRFALKNIFATHIFKYLKKKRCAANFDASHK